MSEDERTHLFTPEDTAPKPTTAGPADATYGAADPATPSGGVAPGDNEDELAPSPTVHGEEGGGAPDAGAEQDTPGGLGEDRRRPRGWTPGG